MRFWRNVADLFPGYFAMVMATGIVAIGAQLEDIGWLADVLYVVAAVAYVVLAVLSVARLARYPGRLAGELTSHAKGFSFLTLVAGTNVLGSASAVVHGWWGLARGLWWASLPLWVVLVYATLFAVVLRADKPGLGAGINGTWFLLTVSVESIASLGALLVAHDGNAAHDLLVFATLATFTLGLVLYLIVMTMVFLRWTFQPLDPAEAAPPAWIAAGAVAITVLAGSLLLLARQSSERLDRLGPFIEGLVVLAWSTATFWFPLMVAIGVWRHIVRRLPLRYHPSYWAMVFPLGMYGVSTHRMLAATQLGHLGWLPKLTLGVALTAWAAATFGLALQAVTAVARRPAVDAPR